MTDEEKLAKEKADKEAAEKAAKEAEEAAAKEAEEEEEEEEEEEPEPAPKKRRTRRAPPLEREDYGDDVRELHSRVSRIEDARKKREDGHAGGTWWWLVGALCLVLVIMARPILGRKEAHRGSRERTGPEREPGF